MKNVLISCAFLLGFISCALAQTVSNVNWEVDDQDRIVITYDLISDGQYRYFDIVVKAALDNKSLLPTAINGDVGNYIKAGKGKKIVWNVLEDVSQLDGELTIEVIASNPIAESNTSNENNPEIKTAAPTVPIWAGLGGVGLTGLGLISTGAISEANGQQLYTIYKDNRNENASVYDELSREEHYTEANKKHKRGVALMLGGGAVLVVGGAILVNRLIQLNKISNSRVSLSPQIEWDQAGNILPNTTGTNVGFRMTYTISK